MLWSTLVTVGRQPAKKDKTKPRGTGCVRRGNQRTGTAPWAVEEVTLTAIIA